MQATESDSLELPLPLPQVSLSGALLHKVLANRIVTLADVLPGPHVPHWQIDAATAGAGARTGKCLVARIDRAVVASAALTPAVWQALGLTPDAPPALLNAIAAAALGPLWRPLRAFFDAPFEIGIATLEGEGLWGEPAFAFTTFIEPWATWLECHLHERFVPQLLAVAGQVSPPRRAPRALALMVCQQHTLSLRELRALTKGDVILDEPAASDDEGCARLCTEFFNGLQPSVQLARVRLADGRIEHVGPSGWAAVPRAAPVLPCVNVDLVLARLSLPRDRCRALRVGEHIDDWERLDASGRSRLQLAGSTLAELRRIRIGGAAGHEVVSISRAMRS